MVNWTHPTMCTLFTICIALFLFTFSRHLLLISVCLSVHSLLVSLCSSLPSTSPSSLSLWSSPAFLNHFILRTIFHIYSQSITRMHAVHTHALIREVGEIYSDLNDALCLADSYCPLFPYLSHSFTFCIIDSYIVVCVIVYVLLCMCYLIVTLD